MIKKNSLFSLRLTNHRNPIAPIGACLFLSAGSALAAETDFMSKPELTTNLNADLILTESYDSNVYLEDKSPGPGAPDAMPALKGSWVTTITPSIRAHDLGNSDFHTSLSYRPDIVIYHNAHSEDYVDHHVGVIIDGQEDHVTWEQANAFTYIDGNHLGPIFAHPQDVPAIGGIPLRNRRDAAIYLGSFRLTYTFDRFFIRPAANAYVHNFKTAQMPNPPNEIYVNYIDRQDVNGGLDVGYDVGHKTYLVLGYRYGRQDQYKLLGVDSPFDSAYHRILFGIEGSPVSWLKLAMLGGPEIRDWANGTPANFDRNRLVYWVNATASVLPNKNDTITLLFRRYEQPAFCSQSVYNDITYSATWKHNFNKHLSATAGFQLYIGDWQAPANRNDWIYTPSASLTWAFNKHFNANLEWSYDLVDNKSDVIPGTSTEWADGREFSRNLISLAMECVF